MESVRVIVATVRNLRGVELASIAYKIRQSLDLLAKPRNLGAQRDDLGRRVPE
jgi:hypothetical protein